MCPDCLQEIRTVRRGKRTYAICGCGENRIDNARKTPRRTIGYTGGGVANACHGCGCALEECECPAETQR